MANGIVVPFEPWHYLEAVQGLYPWLDHAKAADAYRQAGPAFTLFIEEAIAACAGVCTVWRRGDAWAIVTDVGRAHPMIVHRTVKRRLAQIIDEYRLIRVQADVVRTFYAGRAWAHRLGFDKESTLRKFGPQGEDFIRYVLLPKGDEVRGPLVDAMASP